ncbi:MAG: GNAT family N-acetyltransferase [bacterium]|nr:GNAT family N-acetyltransferase [bacterium]
MKIGILYNLVDCIECGLETDVLSYNEITEVVEDVLRILEDKHEVIPVRIRRELLPCLGKKSFDLIFNLCEGIDANPHGEAWVAGLLDIIGIPYTGSDSLTLGLCLNKVQTKHLFKANNIPTPHYQIFSTSSQRPAPELKFPLFVKPSCEDASIGIKTDSVVYNKLELSEKVEFILKNYHQPALVEEYIDGRELNVAIIGNGDSIDILPISEIVFKFCKDLPNIVSYEAKWLEDSEMFQRTAGICSSNLPEDIERHIKRLAVDAYHLTGCRDYARVDFRLKDGRPYVLEVNPNPSIKIDSGFARSAFAAGISYNELIGRILLEAMKRYQMEKKVTQAGSSRVSHDLRTTPHLIAESVVLRHVPLLVKWFNDPDISRYMDTPNETYSKETIIEKFFVLNQDDINLIISEKEGSKEIGFCSIYNINRSTQSGEVSFLIGEKQFQGKGYGKEMVKLLLSSAFCKVGLNSITATVTQQNCQSVKVLEQAGFRKIGIRRQYHFLNEEKLDEILFEMIEEDYSKFWAPFKNQLTL